MSDILIWTTIGNKKFCSFKKKIETNTFCRNVYNISGLCSRQACPLANSRYATVLEHQGKLYLYMKTAERAHTPRDLWERIPLHPNFLRALAQINAHLQFWPRFIRKRAKLRLTRIHQYLIRMRRMHGKQRVEIHGVHKKTERQDRKREQKAHRAAQLQDTIKHELLQRLRQGTWGDLYDDIVNYDNKQFNKVLDEEVEEDEEFDWLEEKQPKQKQKQKQAPKKKTTKFVEAYSDDEEDDQEEDEDLEYEYEYENENTKQKQRIRQGMSNNDNDDDDIDDNDDDDDELSDDDEYIGPIDEDDLDLGYDFDEDDDFNEDDDDDQDIEDQVPDFQLIKTKQQQQIVPPQQTKSIPTSKPKQPIITKTQIKSSKSTSRGRSVDDE